MLIMCKRSHHQKFFNGVLNQLRTMLLAPFILISMCEMSKIIFNVMCIWDSVWLNLTNVICGTLTVWKLNSMWLADYLFQIRTLFPQCLLPNQIILSDGKAKWLRHGAHSMWKNLTLYVIIKTFFLLLQTRINAFICHKMSVSPF